MNIYPLLLHPAEESECVSTVHADGRSHRDVTHSLANALKPRDWVAVSRILSFQFETRKYHIWTCGRYLRWAMIGAREQHVPAMLAHPPIGRPQLYAHFCSKSFACLNWTKWSLVFSQSFLAVPAGRRIECRFSAPFWNRMLRPSWNTANGHNENMKVDLNSAKAATIERSHYLTLRNLRELTGEMKRWRLGCEVTSFKA